MRLRKTLLGTCLALIFQLGFATSPAFAGKDLSIDPVIQETPVWCWVAVGEMTFKHFDVPSVNPTGGFQCGIIAVHFGPYSSCWNNCGSCVVPGRNIRELQGMLFNYSQFTRQFRREPSTAILTSYAHSRSLTKKEIKNEIDNDRPVITGVNPSGFAYPGVSQHVALITAYSETGNSITLTVNDPYPYWINYYRGRSNPYTLAGGSQIKRGQYKILFSKFVRGLSWNTTISQIGSYKPPSF